MGKFTSSIAAISLLGFAAAPAVADIYKTSDAGLYAGANYTFVNADDNSFDADLGTLSGKVGANVTPFFGLEARAGFGVKDDDVANGLAEVSVNSFFGGYATVSLANESPVTPYAILGFSRYELELESGVGSEKDDDSDLSYGIGVNVAMTESLSGNLEYMRYYDKDDITIDGIGLGLTVNF